LTEAPNPPFLARGKSRLMLCPGKLFGLIGIGKMSRPVAQPPTVDEFVKRMLESRYHVLMLIRTIEGERGIERRRYFVRRVEGKIWTTQPLSWAGDELMSLDVLRSICAQLNPAPEVLDYDLTWIPPVRLRSALRLPIGLDRCEFAPKARDRRAEFV
jgi:hypothetical protein